jgi:hypothetical protein
MKTSFIVAALACFLGAIAGRPFPAPGQATVASRAYVGHENDRDMRNFVGAYPKAAGTRLDDCPTCHRAGVARTDTEREFSPCGYCHLIPFPNGRYKTGLPGDFRGTLNAYGLAYENAGRTVEALKAVAGADSDGDGAPNSSEIADSRLPGDPASRPGQPLAPTITLTWDKILSLPATSQFMLMNTTKEPTDEYVNYTGVAVRDLLAAAGVDLAGAAGITVFAPDGYAVDYSFEDIVTPFPGGFFYSGPRGLIGPAAAFVRYPESIPAGVGDGKAIPGTPRLLLAYERDGKLLVPSTYEKGTGRLTGEGPFRLVKPMKDMGGDPARPGRPDRMEKAGRFGDGWDFSASIDHNAGACVRGACVIRVNPMPSGREEVDWKNGWPLVADRRLAIFGRGVR